MEKSLKEGGVCDSVGSWGLKRSGGGCVCKEEGGGGGTLTLSGIAFVL